VCLRGAGLWFSRSQAPAWECLYAWLQPCIVGGRSLQERHSQAGAWEREEKGTARRAPTIKFPVKESTEQYEAGGTFLLYAQVSRRRNERHHPQGFRFL